jgi:hypothetical protein
MPALVHTTFRVSNAKQFKESFEEKTEHGVAGYIPMSMMYIDPITLEPSLTTDINTQAKKDAVNDIPFYALDDQMYLFIGRVSAWNSRDTPDGSIDPNINENNPPYPVDSMKDAHFNHWDDMIAAKKVSAKEVSHVIKRERADEIKEGVRNWTRGMRYDTYDDRADNLFDDDIMIHTVNERFRVYKCIKQGVGRFVTLQDTAFAAGVSGIDAEYLDTTTDATQPIMYLWDHASYREPKNTIMESGVSEDFMTVGGDFQDGYQWKYYYTIDAGEALKFVTTSYIPVRTIRKENGSREDDFSDQWKVEEASLPGGIMNVLVDKVPIEGTDGTVYGYELTGGGVGYINAHVANTSGQINWDGTNMTFKVGQGVQGKTNAATEMSLSDTTQLWPEPFAKHANQLNDNQFKFDIAGTPLGDLFNGDPSVAAVATEVDNFLKNYGIVITEYPGGPATPAEREILSRYVFPIESAAFNGAAGNASLELQINADWISERIRDADFGASTIEGLGAVGNLTNEPIAFSIHPKVNIQTNHQASTVCDRTDSFEAYAICEPFFDWDGTGVGAVYGGPKSYWQGSLGRVVDVRVVNPGRFHYRIDAAWVAPQVDPSTAVGSAEAWNSRVWDWATEFAGGKLDSHSGTLMTSVSGKALANPKVFACIPPVGGHGFDPVSEFGGFNVMINARFEGTEADEFTVGNEFRKIGILKNPLSYANTQPGAGYSETAVRNDLNALWMGDGDYTNLFRGYKTDQCYRINLADDSFKVGDTSGGAPSSNVLFFEPDMEVAFYMHKEQFAAPDWESSTRYNGTLKKTYTHPGADTAAPANELGRSQPANPATGNHTSKGDYIARAKLVDHDKINKRIRVIKPRDDFYTVLQGTPFDPLAPPGTPAAVRIEVRSITPHSVEGDNVFAASLQTVNTAEEPGMLPGSGHILYVENRSMVSRSQNQTEDLKISIQF